MMPALITSRAIWTDGRRWTIPASELDDWPKGPFGSTRETREPSVQASQVIQAI